MKNQEKPVRRASSDLLNTAMSEALRSLERIQSKRGRRLLALVIHGHIDRTTAYEVDNMLRQMGSIDDLDILLNSAGGDIDAAYKTLKIIRSYAKNTAIIVPFYAKSAASLIALGGDQLILSKGGELGPMDPQVKDIYTGAFVPANSIKETVAFLEGLNDPVIKVSLTEQIPPLMVGAYRASAKASRQYLEEVLTDRGVPYTKALIDMFTEKFFSHGYPMDAKFLNKNGIETISLDAGSEPMIYELLDLYLRVIESGGGDNADSDVSVIQSDAGYTVIRNNSGAVRVLHQPTQL